MTKIVVVNGKPGCGKTTFEHLCAAYDIENVNIISTVDYVKEVAKFCGWNGIKNLKSRKFLSDLKYALSDWADIPFQKIRKKIAELNKKEKMQILFVDSREPAEIARFKEELGAMTLLVRRPGDEEEETSNSADANVFNYDYDFVVFNNLDLEALNEKALKVMNILEGENKAWKIG